MTPALLTERRTLLQQQLLDGATQFGHCSVFIAVVPMQEGGTMYSPDAHRVSELWGGKGSIRRILGAVQLNHEGHSTTFGLILCWPSDTELEAAESFLAFAGSAGALLVANGQLTGDRSSPECLWCAAVVCYSASDGKGRPFGAAGRGHQAFMASLHTWREIWSGYDAPASQEGKAEPKSVGRPRNDEEALNTLRLYESGNFATQAKLAAHLDLTPSAVSKQLSRARELSSNTNQSEKRE